MVDSSCRRSRNVVLLWGKDAFAILRDLKRREHADLQILAEAIDVYAFDSDAEAEAFRLGIAAARTREDVFELVPRDFQAVRLLVEKYKRSSAGGIFVGRKLTARLPSSPGGLSGRAAQ